MLDKDLWIGDHVRLLKSDRIGKYDGKHPNGKARIAVDGKIILTPYSNLELYTLPQSAVPLIQPEDRPTATPNSKFQPIIDLHIEVLSPDLLHQSIQLILRRQITACTSFIKKTIELRYPQCTIIHGVGKGALRQEVTYLLNQFSEVIRTELIHNGGATLVTFRYP